MWPFSSHPQVGATPILRGAIDYHSHLLPGVDDGIRSLDEALATLALMEQQGVAEVWLTPHVMEDIPNGTSDLRARFAALREAYSGTITLHLAAEYMLDHAFTERLEGDDLLPFTTASGSRYLLVETSYFSPPMNLEGLLQEIMRAGYYPLLAHPERYDYMPASRYRRLRELGVLFQLNLPALTGHYGSHVRAKAQRLLHAGAYALFGSDTHSLASYRHLLGDKIKPRDRDALIKLKQKAARR